MNQYYTLSTAAVMDTAISLMQENGTTTTLEVKRSLRNQGYWAVQATVSRLMQYLAIEFGWDFFDTGRFRLYFMAHATEENEEAPVVELYLN